jgi:tetratricopeptide (TPR) repeat protein/DNA-binding SARP family transcriptional activator
MSRLRKAFERAGGNRGCILQRSGGYLIEVPRESIDWHRFVAAVTAGRSAHDAGRHDDAAELLWRGLDEWHGPALGDIERLGVLKQQMEERRLFAAELLATIELGLGEAERVVPVLSNLAWLHPGRERLVELLLRGLDATGRGSETTDIYLRTRRHLRDEHGRDPSAPLLRAHEDILRKQADRPPAITRPARSLALPAASSVFAGRQHELNLLLGLGARPGGPMVCVVNGMPGVGKTELVLHAAHRLAERFPDAQLHINLQAHNTSAAPVEQADALGRLLRTLTADDEPIPAQLDERADEFRALLAGKRALLVLDDAPGRVADIRHLLPTGTDCLVLITSRGRLAALDEAATISLDVLPAEDARTLFARVAGTDRVADQAGAVEQIVGLCGGLPLAIRIVAARLRSHPHRRPDRLAERLSNVHLQLSELDDGERSVSAAFTLSYQDLDPEQRSTFRLFSLIPAQDLDADAVAALAAASLSRATHTLDRLLDAHLISQQVDGRYGMHDLVRLWASEQSKAEDDDAERRQALLRWLDHELRTATAAMDVLFPHERSRRPRPTPEPRAAFAVSTPPRALAWLDAERPNLLAAAAVASAWDRPAHAWMLDATLYRYLLNGAHHVEALELHRHALNAARAEGNRAAEAAARGHVGATSTLLGRFEDALANSSEALAIHRALRDRHEEAVMLTDRGIVLAQLGRLNEAQDHLLQALVLDQELGSLHESCTLANLGNVAWSTGAFESAHHYYQLGLAGYAEAGDVHGEASMLINLGSVHFRRGHYPDAIAHFERALDLSSSLGSRGDMALVLSNLGGAYRENGQPERALDLHRRALDLARAIRQPAGEINALTDLAATYLSLGRLDDSVDYYEWALQLARNISDKPAQAQIMNGLGAAFRDRGDLAGAEATFRAALESATSLQDSYQEGIARVALADLLQGRGRTFEAHWQLRVAVGLLSPLGVPEGAQLCARLSRYDEGSDLR